MIFQTLPQNTIGRDFVVGDIHGCFTQLRALLDVIGFDESKDRLLSVGDLVDRGPESADCLDWLDKPWFFAVRGNHEETCIELVENPCNKQSDGHRRNIVRSNGGTWFLDMDEKHQKVYADMFRELPVAIEVMTPNGLVGIVHAECPLADWADYKAQLPSNEHLQTLSMWSRLRVRARSNQEVANVSLVISGHTPLPSVKVVGNSAFIDTGRCFKDGHFSILDITNEQLYRDENT